MRDKVVLFWFRRDLRLEDNTGLARALASGYPVVPLFIFDTEILNRLEDKYDRRVDYIHQALSAINETLRQYQSGLHVFHGTATAAFTACLQQYEVQAVYCNRDYEPKAIKRDEQVKELLSAEGVVCHSYKDQVIFDQSDVLKPDNNPYTVYTPYAKKWRSLLMPEHLAAQEVRVEHFHKTGATKIPGLEAIGFIKTDISSEAPQLDIDLISDYDKYRDYPALQRTTLLGIALRFGTISIRRCVAFALQHNGVWLAELIWREFFMQILFHFPRVVSQAFKMKYDFIEWRNNEAEFARWCIGDTGYPIVDAGMRQLNQTGFMHNRVRMIVASFLCKHLLIDWRWGEAYFAQKLNDYDLSANNGNWQWAAGCGCDAAPYFRIFNPYTQTLKFDKELKYLKTWNPDFDQQITLPIVTHEAARERALKTYKKALEQTR
ncbi:MAG: deoxyribodipyrimidine photo-lyase [Sphingobacteriales bacterium]|nr:MAG: deoxyribodipyrimidine photo-lyase [Sphingobacteriales bacterium]